MQKNNINQLLGRLEPISLTEMDGVKLLSRIDRKYIIPINSLPQIFDLLRDQYFILDIDGRRAFNYVTTYFDTTDYRFYQDHHNDLSSRIKVRSRTYKDSNLHFFEVKMKNNLRTNKYREVLKGECFTLSEKQCEKIRAIYQNELTSPLIPALLNNYTRITLVNKAKTERCTIDINLSFQDPGVPEGEIGVDGIAIIELKQDKINLSNGIAAALRAKRIYPSSISKYVLGIIHTHPEINHSTFKPLLQKIGKVQQQNFNQQKNNYEKVAVPAYSM